MWHQSRVSRNFIAQKWMLCLKRKNYAELAHMSLHSVVCERTEKMPFEARALDHSLVAEAHTPMFVQYWATEIFRYTATLCIERRNRMEKFKRTSTRSESLSSESWSWCRWLFIFIAQQTESKKERGEKYTLTRLYNKKLLYKRN